jgi:tRNA pseudouridine13 synthase
VTPLAPPFAFPELASVGGRIGPEPEDFVVDEIPLYAASGQGAHLYARIEKRQWTTARLVRALSEVSGVKERDIGYAGLKDRQAVTTQWFSFPDVKEEDAQRWQLPDGTRVLELSRHNNKLRTGHLAGNRFRIRLVDVDPASHSALEPILQAIKERGLPNYYGRQRFGREGNSLDQALSWLQGKSRVKDRFLLKLLPSVIQAEGFNRYLLQRSELGFDKLLNGEVVRLEGSSKMFVVEDSDKELPRLLARDIHLTGPLFGPKMKAATGPALEFELRCLSGLGLSVEHLERMGERAPGARRDLVLYPRHFSFELGADASVVLVFELPAGAYATQVVGEFTRSDSSADVRDSHTQTDA